LLLGLIWAGFSELHLLRFMEDYQPLEAFNLIQVTQAKLITKTVKLDLLPNKEVVGEVRWSAGNKTYSYLQLWHNKKVIMDFWGTNSLLRKPKVWLQKSRCDEPSFIVTYQPEVFPSATPLGKVRSGFLLWKYDGRVYGPTPLGVCPITLWMRNPFPLQD
jgi:hypothetical protein